MFQELKKQVQYFIQNKLYMVSLIFAAIAGYGYEITHTSMGIDDVCIEIYFDEGLAVAIGRWPFYLINKVFHITDFEPFIMEQISVSLMVLAAVLWSATIRFVLKREIPLICYIIFSAMFVNYSLIAEVFIYYLQNGIGIIYCLTAIAIFELYYIKIKKMTWKEEIPYIVSMSMILCVTISFYESAAALFLFGILFMMLTDAISDNLLGLHRFKNCFISLFTAARVLVYGIVGRSIITKICMFVFGIDEYNYRSVTSALWIFKYPLRVITLFKQFLRDYVVIGLEYYPIGLFVIATTIFIVVVFYLTIKKRNMYIVILGMGAYCSIFLLSLIQGDILPYRANQMLSVFVSAVLLYVSYVIMRQKVVVLRWVGMILVISVIYNSAFDLNHWFAFEYKRNQQEIEDVHHVSYDLKKGGYDIKNKPVVFVGEYEVDASFEKEYSITSESHTYSLIKSINESMGEITPEWYPYTQVLSYSFLDWTITGFSVYEGYNREIIRLFEKEGLSLIWGGNELYQKGVEQMDYLNCYPMDGYIKEFDEYILVRF